MPGAMRLLSGLPVALATEHRAIVGELHCLLALMLENGVGKRAHLLEMTSVK